MLARVPIEGEEMAMRIARNAIMNITIELEDSLYL